MRGHMDGTWSKGSQMLFHSLLLQLLLFLFSCVPAVVAFGFVWWALYLLPVGLAVLVDETHFRLRVELERRWIGLRGRGWGQKVVMGMGMVAAVLWFYRDVRLSQRLHNLPVQDPQGDARHGVFEVVLGCQAVIKAGIRLGEGFQQDAMPGLQDLFVSTELKEKRSLLCPLN